MVPVTLLSGLNSSFSRSDSKFDSISAFLRYCKVVSFHILVRYGKVFIAVFFKHRAIDVERDIDICVSEDFL